MVHRKEKLMGPECVIHPSRKLCKTSNKGGYWDDELPDLPAVPMPKQTSKTLPHSRSGQTLQSPPKVHRTSTRHRTCTETAPIMTNVGQVSATEET